MNSLASSVLSLGYLLKKNLNGWIQLLCKQSFRCIFKLVALPPPADDTRTSKKKA